jgi:hypothetical protein
LPRSINSSFRPIPLDLALTLNAPCGSPGFKPSKGFHAIRFLEAGYCISTMLLDPTRKIIGHAGIQRSVSATR